MIKCALHQVLSLLNNILSVDNFIFYNNCVISFLNTFIPAHLSTSSVGGTTLGENPRRALTDTFYTSPMRISKL